MKLRSLVTVLLLLGVYDVVQAAPPPQEKFPRMVVVKDKDVSGTVRQKLGLPNLQYCWDACLKEDRCTGARWGVIEGDTAGLCFMMSGTLTFKAPMVLKTEDGKRIRVIVGRKQRDAADGGV